MRNKTFPLHNVFSESFFLLPFFAKHKKILIRQNHKKSLEEKRRETTERKKSFQAQR